MAKSFDFNKIKPKTMNVTLSDEKKTTLVVMTPDKKLKEELENLKNEIENADEDETLDILYDLTARLMSRNKNGIVITIETLKELYEDESYILAFLEAYSEFVNELVNSKN